MGTALNVRVAVNRGLFWLTAGRALKVGLITTLLVAVGAFGELRFSPIAAASAAASPQAFVWGSPYVVQGSPAGTQVGIGGLACASPTVCTSIDFGSSAVTFNSQTTSILAANPNPFDATTAAQHVGTFLCPGTTICVGFSHGRGTNPPIGTGAVVIFNPNEPSSALAVVVDNTPGAQVVPVSDGPPNGGKGGLYLNQVGLSGVSGRKQALSGVLR